MNISSPELSKSGLPKVALIAGPTASGKSALALALAEKLNGTIINADSMQVYRDLRILTARPSTNDEARAPHRLFGHVDGADAYSAARWAADARSAIDEAHAARRLPILVGGTGLYMRTLLDGIAPVPDIDPDIRAEIRALAVASAHAALKILDPASAEKLSPSDSNRVSRALEVVRSTGRPLHSWQAEKHGGIGTRIDLTATILLPDRDWLGERIDRRFDWMARHGMEEVAALLAREDLPIDAPILRAIGVPELGNVLSYTTDLERAITDGSLATRQYAKRQYTWFRRQPPDSWQRTTETQTNVLLDSFVIKLRK